jgi:hypothetical protein
MRHNGADLEVRRVGRFLPMLQVELCLLCLSPGFPAVPPDFNHTSVGPCPSQNRACAIRAHGSSDSLSRSMVEVSLHTRFWPWETLEQFVECCRRVAPSLASPIQPLVQQLLHLAVEAVNASVVVCHSIVLVVSLKLQTDFV